MSNLRSVELDWDVSKKMVFVYFYFDNDISDVDMESARRVAQATSTAFDKETKILESCIRLNFPARIPAHQLCVYQRRE